MAANGRAPTHIGNEEDGGGTTPKRALGGNGVDDWAQSDAKRTDPPSAPMPFGMNARSLHSPARAASMSGAPGRVEDDDMLSPPASPVLGADEAMADADELYLPPEILQAVLLAADPNEVPVLATASAAMASAVFQRWFVNEVAMRWTRPNMLADVVLRAIDRHKLYFVRNIWPLLPRSIHKVVVSETPAWAFVYLQHIFPTQFRALMRAYLRERSNARAFGTVDNALLVRREWDREQRQLMLEVDATLIEQGSELPGIEPWRINLATTADMSTLASVLGRPLGTRSTEQRTNLPVLDMLARHAGFWSELMVGDTAQRIDRFLFVWRQYPDTLFVLARAKWGREMLTDLHTVDAWTAALCHLPLTHVRFLVRTIGYRPHVARAARLAMVERADLALWLLGETALWHGGIAHEALRRLYVMSRRHPAFARKVDGMALFNKIRTNVGRVNRTTVSDETRASTRELYYDYDNDEISRLATRPLDVRHQSLSAASAEASHDAVARALLHVNEMSALLDAAPGSFFTDLASIGVESFARASADGGLAMHALLADPRVRLPVLVARALVEQFYDAPALMRAVLMHLGPATSAPAVAWRCQLLQRWIRLPQARTLSPADVSAPLTMAQRTVQQHAVHTLLTAATPFDFSALDWRELAMAQNDDRYYLFALLARQPGFDPASANGALVRAAYARGELAFVDMWLGNERAMKAFDIRRPDDVMLVSQMRTLLDGVSL